MNKKPIYVQMMFAIILMVFYGFNGFFNFLWKQGFVFCVASKLYPGYGKFPKI